MTDGLKTTNCRWIAVRGAVDERGRLNFIEGGKARNHAPDGTVTDSEIKAGVTVYREPVTHWTENIGTTTIRAVIIELKPAH